MDRNRDLAKGLSRIENQLANKKYFTVTITPTCQADSVASNGVVFNPTTIPGACPNGRASRLMSIVVHDGDDTLSPLTLFFTKVAKDFGTLGAEVSISTANMKLAKPLGMVQTLNEYNSFAGDYLAGGINTNTNFDLIVESDANDNSNGDIYVAGLALSLIHI